MRGKFIVFEGIDYTGKTTQSSALVEQLNTKGYPTTYIREPGGTAIGEQIRTILLNKTNTEMSPQTELLLYMSARSQLVHEVIQPQLSQSMHLVSDRYLFSSIAYQGTALGLDPKHIMDIGLFAIQNILPDLTIILDMPPVSALQRHSGSKDRIEERGIAFQEKVRTGFLEIAEQFTDSCLVIDASQPFNIVQDQVWKAVANVI